MIANARGVELVAIITAANSNTPAKPISTAPNVDRTRVRILIVLPSKYPAVRIDGGGAKFGGHVVNEGIRVRESCGGCFRTVTIPTQKLAGERHSVPRYFAYGSNMSSRQMAERCPGSTVISPALLPGYALEFDRASQRWGGFVADIVAREDSETWGVLWDVSEAHLELLDHFEGVAAGAYRRINVTVIAPDGERYDAVSYQVVEPVSPGHPSEAYEAILEQGAREHGLPASYVSRLCRKAGVCPQC